MLWLSRRHQLDKIRILFSWRNGSSAGAQATGGSAPAARASPAIAFLCRARTRLFSYPPFQKREVGKGVLRWQAVRCIDRHALGWPSDSGALLSGGRALVTLEPREPRDWLPPCRGAVTPSRRSRRSWSRSDVTTCRPWSDRPPTRQSSPPLHQPRSLVAVVTTSGHTLMRGLCHTSPSRIAWHTARVAAAASTDAPLVGSNSQGKKYAPRSVQLRGAYCISSQPIAGRAITL